MTAQPPLSPNRRQPEALPDLSRDVVTRLVAGRCYFVDMSVAEFRHALELAREQGLTVIPAGCEANLSAEEDDFTIQGPFVVGRQVVWTSASMGPSDPFDSDEVQQVDEAVGSVLGAELEEKILDRSGPASSVESGVFLCSTGPKATGTLVFGVAGTRQEAELTGGEYVWGHDLEKLPHASGVIGEVVASVEFDEVEKVDFSDESDRRRREATVPYADEPVYFLVAQYD